MGFKKILVTGADGFIGSHLTEALVRKGYNVRAFVLYNSFNSWGWLDECAADVKGRFEVFAGEIGNWRNFAEQLLQAFGSKPVKTGNLCFDEIGYVNCVALLTEGVPQFAFFGTGSVGKNQRWQCDMDILRRHGNLASIGR